MFSEVAEIALVAARLGQFQQLPKTRVILILNFTRPHAITYTNNYNNSNSNSNSDNNNENENDNGNDNDSNSDNDNDND